MQTRKWVALLAAAVFTLGLAGGALAMPAHAADETILLDADCRSLFADTGKGLPLSSLQVVLDQQTLDGTEVQWTVDDGLRVENGSLIATRKGVHRLTASHGEASLELYMAVKEAGDDAYILCEETFDDVADGTLPDGWKRIEGTEGNLCVQDGKLQMDARKAVGRILLPTYLKAFGDYQVEADLQIMEYNDAGRWSALMFRIQNEDYPYYQMCVRAAATLGNGVEFSEKTPAGAWNVMKIGSFTESLSAAKSYQLAVRAEGERIVESINGVNILDTTVSGLRKTGDVGLQVNGNLSLFDNIRVVVPVERMPERPKAAEPYVPQTSLVNPPAVVTAPQTAEELETWAEAPERPSHLLLRVDDALSCVGLSLTEALKTIGSTCIPVLEVESAAAADGVAQFLSNWGYADILVMSRDPDLVKRIRNSAPLVGGIVDDSGIDAPELASPAVQTARACTAGANILVLSAAQADRETIAYFQQRFLTVWVKAPEALNATGAVDLTATGTNGIMTSTPAVCYDAYRLFSGDTYLARRPFVIGHRGAPSLAPENTLESAQKAYELGARLIECDIYLTTDNQIVIMHDGMVDRTTDGTGAIESYTLAELKQFKANKGFTTDYPDARIPTLEDYFTFFKGKDVVMVIEIKSGKAEIVEILKDLIADYEIADQCVAISFDRSQLVRTAQSIPALPLGLLASPYGDADLSETVDAFLRYMRPAKLVYSPYTDGLGAGFCRAASLRGLPTSVWTIDSIAYGKTLLAGNVTHLTTNRIQDFMPLVGSVEAVQTEYTLAPGESLIVHAKTHSLAGEDDEQAAELIPIHGSDHINVDGLRVTGRSKGTVKAVLRVPMDAQQDVYLFSRVVTIQVEAPGSGNDDPGDPGDDTPPDSDDKTPPDSGDPNSPDAGDKPDPDAGHADPPDTPEEESPRTGHALPWTATLAGGAAVVLLKATAKRKNRVHSEKN